MIRSLAAAPRTPFERDRALARLAEEHFDVLVIGGGITGAGVALDAAARGLRTALVERNDFASGTSSRSSKLIHGGLRYLQQHDFRLVYEALAERQRLLDNAPHLVSPLAFLIPIFGTKGVVKGGLARLYSTALWQYDLTGGLRIGRRHQRITPEEAQEFLPTLDISRLVTGFLYWDAHADDARLTLTVLRTAVVQYGAVAANYSPVAELLIDRCRPADGGGRASGTRPKAGDDGGRAGDDGGPAGDDVPTGGDNGRVVGARLEDGTEIRARVVVNATGVWSDLVRGMDEGQSAHGTLRPAKGIHLTFPGDRLPLSAAAVLPVPGDRRSIFLVPWGQFTYAGTTDTDYRGPLDDPQCTPADVSYVLDAVNAAVTSKLTRADIVSSWAGLRPLVRSAKDQRTADLSRRHRVTLSQHGLVTITGGKLTTYRRMASDTMDLVVEHLGRGTRRSPTKRLALLGADGSEGLRRPGAAGRLGVDEETLTHLAGRYGTEGRTVIALIEADPELARPLVPGLPYLRAEAVYAARYEMAWTLEDVLARRTRALFLARDASAAAAASVAQLIAPELGWSVARTEEEAAAYRGAVRHAREAAELPEIDVAVLHGRP